MASHKNDNLSANEGFVMFFLFPTKLITCFIDIFTLKNEIPINSLLTQGMWTHILDFGPWKWSALNMDYMDKRPSRMQGSCKGLADRGYDFFRWCLCPPPWRVQHSSEVFRETLLSRGRMGMPTEHICTYLYIYVYVFSVCITILTKTPLNWALSTHRNPGQIISHQTRTIDEMSPQILFPSCPVGPLTSHMPLASFYSTSLQLNGVF